MLARLRRHVDNNVPEAVSLLGTAYSNPNYGLVKSHKKALKLYQRAAELGDVHSWGLLGNYYYHGCGVKSDRKKTARFYRMGADGGDAHAQQNLAWCYENGVGVPRDLDEAKRFYALAAAQGIDDAKEALQRFSNAP